MTSRPEIERCRSCNAEMVWLLKPRGNGRMCVDLSDEALRRKRADEPWVPGVEGLSAHGATCRDAAIWRRTPPGGAR